MTPDLELKITAKPEFLPAAAALAGPLSPFAKGLLETEAPDHLSISRGASPSYALEVTVDPAAADGFTATIRAATAEALSSIIQPFRAHAQTASGETQPPGPTG